MKTLLFVLAISVLTIETFAFAQPSVLDGKTFMGEFGKKDVKKSVGKDELIFKDGKFRSTACDPYGFGDASYTALASGETITFEAETTSPTDGRIEWKGEISGNSLEGTFTWYRPGDQPPQEYWIRAKAE